MVPVLRARPLERKDRVGKEESGGLTLVEFNRMQIVDALERSHWET